MSDRNQARRTTAEVVFGGTDITSSIRSYFLSMTYTDNEEDEADDLQIKLEDRDSIWLEKWLNDAIQAAASSAPTEGAGEAEAKTYKVMPSIGLNVRTGPGTSYGKLGALPYGTEVPVTGISNGWATIQYSGRTAYVSAQYIKEVVGGQAEENSEASATTGLAIQAVFVRENWNNDGKDTVLDCGQFELDSIKASGPPATITIKATSLPFNAQIRQTEKTKAWEAYTLSGIAQEMAGANGMACLYESASDPYLGVDPMTEVVKIWNYERSGTAVPLTIGTHAYGKYRWSIKSHKMKAQTYDKRGDITSATISLTLQEYI